MDEQCKHGATVCEPCAFDRGWIEATRAQREAIGFRVRLSPLIGDDQAEALAADVESMPLVSPPAQETG
jgi:hypothetical protein